MQNLFDLSSFNNDKNKVFLHHIDLGIITFGDILETYQLLDMHFGNEKCFTIIYEVKNEMILPLTVPYFISNKTIASIDLASQALEDFHLIELMNVDYIVTDQKKGILVDKANEYDLGLIEVEYNQNLIIKNIKHPKKIKTKRDDIALYNTTTGTTSASKIIINTREDLKKYISDRDISHLLNSDDTILLTRSLRRQATTPLFLSAMALKAKVISSIKFDFTKLVELVIKHDIKYFYCPPAILRGFIDFAKKNNLKPFTNNLKRIRTGGGPLNIDEINYIQNLFNTKLVYSYGMTELGLVNGIASTLDQPNGFKEGSVGIPILDVKIIEDEVCVKVENDFECYLNAENPVIDGYFHTGDLGFIEQDGYLFITGRIKEIINKDGLKISPYEVESAILKHDFIKEAVVFPIVINENEDMAAGIIFKDGQRISLKQMKIHLSHLISNIKIPSLFYVLDKFPLINGKIDRKSMQKYVQNHDFQVLKSDLKLTEELSSTEKMVLNIWQKYLKVKNISKKDNWNSLGGDSLSTINAIIELENLIGINIPSEVYLNNTILEDLANWIDTNKDSKIKKETLYKVKESSKENAKTLIFVHLKNNEFSSYFNLLKNLDDDFTIYSFKFDRFTYLGNIYDLNELANFYANQIKNSMKKPFYLIGFSFGGKLANAISYACEVKNLPLIGTIMLDTRFPGYRESHLLIGIDRPKTNGLFDRYIFIITKNIREFKKVKKGKYKSFLLQKVKSAMKRFKNLLKTIFPSLRNYIYNKTKSKYLLKTMSEEQILYLMGRKYKPKFQKSNIIFFNGTQNDKFSLDFSISKWKLHTTDIKVFNFDFNHSNFIDSNNAPVVAKKINEIVS